jgi:AraC-like DNA-binding protein
MRSTRGEDYQHVPRAVAVMPKTYESGATSLWHSHPRAQLLYATGGLTLVRAEDGTWVLPAHYALWIPPGLAHEVTMHGTVSMCSAYVAPDAISISAGCRVLEVSPLLEAALAALAQEPVLYDVAGRGGHLAALILDEIARAPETPLTLPLPTDPRLRRVCTAIMEAPGSALGLDEWADRAGASRRTLTRSFRSETGLSFGEWRLRARVIRALALSAEGLAPHAVARAVGYAGPRALEAAMQRVALASGSPGATVPPRPDARPSSRPL